jgi:hypothetical protein
MALEEYVAGIPFDGDIDVAYFVKMPNAFVAQQRLDFMVRQSNIHELLRRGYGGAALTAMWLATYRACLAYGVSIPTDQQGHARELGVVIP